MSQEKQVDRMLYTCSDTMYCHIFMPLDLVIKGNMIFWSHLSVVNFNFSFEWDTIRPIQSIIESVINALFAPKEWKSRH